jgi:hypothetical protein
VWSDVEDGVIGGDLTAALAYVTPAGGAVVTPVAPLGLRDRAAGTVSFTTSLGFGRKLERIDSNPCVALAYHSRDLGFAQGNSYVLVQGTATYDAEPDPAVLAELVQPASARFLGAPRRGPFWDRWLHAYYDDRVLVTVSVGRVCSWPDSACVRALTVYGAPLPEATPAPQEPPRNGTGPRVSPARLQRRARALAHALLGYVGADGFPFIAPVRIGAASEAGVALSGPLPPGGRRAGLLAHSYGPELVGLRVRQCTGWLADGVYAPHTENGFRAPENKTLLLLANGLLARRGLAQARKRGAVRAAHTRARA